VIWLNITQSRVQRQAECPPTKDTKGTKKGQIFRLKTAIWAYNYRTKRHHDHALNQMGVDTWHIRNGACFLRTIASGILRGYMRSLGVVSARLVLAVTAIAIGHFTTVGQTVAGQSTISGFVFDDARRPMTQVVVELRSEFNSVLQRTRTQASGRYLFSGLGQGRFTVYARPFGTNYRDQSEDVEIAGIGVRGRPLSENVQKDIYLHPLKTEGRVKNAVIFAQEIPPDAERLFKNGSEDIDRQKVDTGIKSLEGAIAVFPNYFQALQKLGFVKLAQADFAGAEPLFERALNVNSDSYESLYGLSVAEVSLKKTSKALPNLEKAIVKRPDSFEANFLMGVAWRQEKKYPEAEKAFKQAEKFSDASTAPDVYWNLALLYAHNMNRYADAAKQLEQYLKTAPEAPNKEAIMKLIKDFKDKARTS